MLATAHPQKGRGRTSTRKDAGQRIVRLRAVDATHLFSSAGGCRHLVHRSRCTVRPLASRPRFPHPSAPFLRLSYVSDLILEIYPRRETYRRHTFDRLPMSPARFYRTLNPKLTSIFLGFLRPTGRLWSPLHFPMQKVEKIRLRMSSVVVWPERESRADSAR